MVPALGHGLAAHLAAVVIEQRVVASRGRGRGVRVAVVAGRGDVAGIQVRLRTFVLGGQAEREWVEHLEDGRGD